MVYMPLPSTDREKTHRWGDSKSGVIAYALTVFVISALNIHLFYQVYQLKKLTHRK